jgi:hypothetical protein
MIEISIYNLYLFICIAENKFRLVRLQTDNNLIITNVVFLVFKKKKLKNIEFGTKLKEKLTIENFLNFNNYILSKEKQKVLVL